MSNQLLRLVAVVAVSMGLASAQKGNGMPQGIGGGGAPVAKPSFGGGSQPGPSMGGGGVRSAPAPSAPSAPPVSGPRSFGGAPSRGFSNPGPSIAPSAPAPRTFSPSPVPSTSGGGARSAAPDSGGAAPRWGGSRSAAPSFDPPSRAAQPRGETFGGSGGGVRSGRSVGIDGPSGVAGGRGGIDNRTNGGTGASRPPSVPRNHDGTGWNAGSSRIPKLAPADGGSAGVGRTGSQPGLTAPAGRYPGNGNAGRVTPTIDPGANSPTTSVSRLPTNLARPGRGTGATEPAASGSSKFSGRPGVALGHGSDGARVTAPGRLTPVAGGGAAADNPAGTKSVGTRALNLTPQGTDSSLERSSFAAGVYSGGSGFGADARWGGGGHHGHHDRWRFHGSFWFGGGFGCYPYTYSAFGGYYPYSCYPYWYGYALWAPFHWPYSTYCGYAYPGFGFGYRSSGWRFSFGFGYSYYPTYYSDCWYPYYRTYRYYPYYYYSTVSYYPVYSTVYHADVVSADYADTSDPYVEFEDEVPAKAAPAVEPAGSDSAARPEIIPLRTVAVPAELRAPLVSGFPDTLGASEYGSRGASAMRSGQYLEAAEAWRRAWLLSPADRTAGVSLAVALFAAERFDLASVAIHEVLVRNPDVATTSDDVVSTFGDAGAFREAQSRIERLIVRNPNEGSARFVLGFIYLKTGNDFGARNEFALLKEVAGDDPQLKLLLQAAERRFLGGPETR